MVSIIIPTFNRSEFLGSTLESIIAQTYYNWECIVVDDGSIDYTNELMHYYCERDSRIFYYNRPEEINKGANACRNFGFEKSKGEFIQWFDSDDIMHPEFLEKKITALIENRVDYVISRTKNFEHPNPLNVIGYNENYYRFDDYPLTHYNYVTQNINWLTPDFLGTRALCERVKFNESLHSSQERNFFSKVTHFSTKAFPLTEYLTLRRMHNKSVQAGIKINRKERKKQLLDLMIETYKELKELNTDGANYYLKEAFLTSFTHRPKLNSYIFLQKWLINIGKFKASLWYLAYYFSMLLFARGHYCRKGFINEFNKKQITECFSL